MAWDQNHAHRVQTWWGWVRAFHYILIRAGQRPIITFHEDIWGFKICFNSTPNKPFQHFYKMELCWNSHFWSEHLRFESLCYWSEMSREPCTPETSLSKTDSKLVCLHKNIQLQLHILTHFINNVPTTSNTNQFVDYGSDPVLSEANESLLTNGY